MDDIDVKTRKKGSCLHELKFWEITLKNSLNVPLFSPIVIFFFNTALLRFQFHVNAAEYPKIGGTFSWTLLLYFK